MKKNTWITEHFTPHEKHLHQLKHTIVSTRTKFQKAILADSHSFGRCLILDGEMQSAQSDEFIYHESLVCPALMLHKQPADVLIMGGGEGATTREVLRYKKLRRVVTVDIDGEVVDFCIKYLKPWHQGAFSNPKSELIIGDARAYVFETGKKFDVIISDLPSPIEGGPAYTLYTVEFYRKLKSILKPGGIFALQAGSGNPLQIKFHKMLYRTLKQVFSDVYAYYSYIPSFDVPWAFMACGDGIKPAKLSAGEINRRIAGRLTGKLSFYDGYTHLGLFNTPKYMRKYLDEEKNVITEKKPVYFFK
ncbi:MAG: hypothetical protein A2219_08785 [Elusimicrobia bacterium RIFOXYA2_FULL_50_26]|nr:MAG: hypothetical protein A2219_08785 [Elusimicrobia bacterium RIFOXYA2_FULL_50_26]